MTGGGAASRGIGVVGGGIPGVAVANGVPGVPLVDGSEMRHIEPAVAGIAGMYSPTTAVVDFAVVVRALAAEAEGRGLTVLLGYEVVAIAYRAGEVRVRTEAGRPRKAAGADRGAGLRPSDSLRRPRVRPASRIRGGRQGPRNRAVPWGVPPAGAQPGNAYPRLVCPVPDPRYPSLGVHPTKRHDGETLVGPNALLALAREGYRRRDLSGPDLWDTLRWPGFRRFAGAHWGIGVHELAGSLSKRLFAAAAARYLPGLAAEDLLPGPSGVRTQAMARDGPSRRDSSVRSRVVAVRNAPSPAATLSLAIAEHLVELLLADHR